MIIKSNNESSVVSSAEQQRAESTLCDETEVTVRVCLRRMFGCRRARCVVRAGRDKPARWLAKRLRVLFPGAVGPGVTVLVSAGYVLPPDEPLAVLTSGDLVEVIPLHRDYGDEDERKFYEKFTSAFTDSDSNLKQNAMETEDFHSERTPLALSSYSECDVTRSEPDTDPNPNPEGDQLQEIKRRALLLVDGYCESSLAADPEEGHKRRRRRVRRRRAPPSAEPIDLAPSAVQQNAGAAARAPRCVLANTLLAE